LRLAGLKANLIMIELVLDQNYTKQIVIKCNTMSKCWIGSINLIEPMSTLLSSAVD